VFFYERVSDIGVRWVLEGIERTTFFYTIYYSLAVKFKLNVPEL
jgi:hypothetical protein